MTYVCDRCGEEWQVHPFSLVDCPECGAKAGCRCRRPSGHVGPLIEFHVKREQAALDAGLIQKCKGKK